MTKAITDFEEWFDCNEPDNAAQLLSLYNSVNEVADDMYKTVALPGKPGRYLVHGPIPEYAPLFLGSEKARTRFLAFVEDKSRHEDFDLEPAASWEYTMANPHS